MTTAVDIASLRPGTVIAVRVAGVHHEGLVSDRPGFVIHKSARVGYAAEESLRDFSRGNRWYVVGYISKSEPSAVIERARTLVGARDPWTVLRNCRHFVRECHRRFVTPTIAGIRREDTYAPARVERKRKRSNPLVADILRGVRHTGERRERIGQIEPAGGFLTAVDALDAEWNLLTETVCGSARSVACDDRLGMGAEAIRGYSEALRRWRVWRDDVRQRSVIWESANAEYDQHRDRLRAWQTRASRAAGRDVSTGVEPQERPATWSEDAASGLARAFGPGLRFGALALGVGLAGLAVVTAASATKGRR